MLGIWLHDSWCQNNFPKMLSLTLCPAFSVACTVTRRERPIHVVQNYMPTYRGADCRAFLREGRMKIDSLRLPLSSEYQLLSMERRQTLQNRPRWRLRNPVPAARVRVDAWHVALVGQ